MTDDLTRRRAEQISRGIKELHEEQNPSAPLRPGMPVAPHIAAQRIGLSPIGRWYAVALEHLEEEGVLERNPCAGNKVMEEPRYVLGERGPELMGNV